MEEIIKELKEQYYRRKAQSDETKRRRRAKEEEGKNALTIKKFNVIIEPLKPKELTKDEKERIIDLHLKQSEPNDVWQEIATDILSAKYYERYKDARRDSVFFEALYNQIVKYLLYFFPNEDIAFSECSNFEHNAMEMCFKLEHMKAEEVIGEYYETNNLVKYIQLKYISFLLGNDKMKANLDFNIQHTFFQLWCENESSKISTIGFKFDKTDNVFGWELVKLNDEAVVHRPIEKIDWQGNQALLAYLFKELENKGAISNKNYVEYICNHFTVNGNQINRNSLKTAVNKARLDIRKFQDKKPIEKQVENIAVRIPTLIDLLDDLEKGL